MDDNPSDPATADSLCESAPSEVLHRYATAEYELRLRSTERVRVLLQKSCSRCAAPHQLVTRIRASLLVVRRG